MRRIHAVAAGLVTAAVMATVVACSSDNGSGPSTGLTGTYTLDTLVVDTGPALFPPVATGTLQFGTPAIFAVSLTLHPPAAPKDSTISISGNYTLSASDSIDLSVLGGLFHIHGTHVESGNKLVLNILVPPGFIGTDTLPSPVHLVWHK
jgi:hypothetical protein